jgi:hypothetical protein
MASLNVGDGCLNPINQLAWWDDWYNHRRSRAGRVSRTVRNVRPNRLWGSRQERNLLGKKVSPRKAFVGPSRVQPSDSRWKRKARECVVFSSQNRSSSSVLERMNNAWRISVFRIENTVFQISVNVWRRITNDLFEALPPWTAIEWSSRGIRFLRCWGKNMINLKADYRFRIWMLSVENNRIVLAVEVNLNYFPSSLAVAVPCTNGNGHL